MTMFFYLEKFGDMKIVQNSYVQYASDVNIYLLKTFLIKFFTLEEGRYEFIYFEL